MDALTDEPIQYRTMIMLLLYTGMRRGELCGLEWSDIDFDNSLIHIQRASLYLPERGIFEDTTKTYTSDRIIKISADTCDLLRDFRQYQLNMILNTGDAWHNENRLFTQYNGKPIHPDSVTNWFHNFIERNNLPSVSIHSLRHTNATLLIAGGTDILTVSSRLGHAQMSTTSNIYTHAIRSRDEAAAETLQDILSVKKKQVKTKKA